MNRFHVKTLAVFVLIAFAAMGAFVLTDNFVPKAHADHGCIPALLECVAAAQDAAEACAGFFAGGPLTPECIAAATNAWNKCKHAWDDCVGG